MEKKTAQLMINLDSLSFALVSNTVLPFRDT